MPDKPLRGKGLTGKVRQEHARGATKTSALRTLRKSLRTLAVKD